MLMDRLVTADRRLPAAAAGLSMSIMFMVRAAIKRSPATFLQDIQI